MKINTDSKKSNERKLLHYSNTLKKIFYLSRMNYTVFTKQLFTVIRFFPSIFQQFRDFCETSVVFLMFHPKKMLWISRRLSRSSSENFSQRFSDFSFSVINISFPDYTKNFYSAFFLKFIYLFLIISFYKSFSRDSTTKVFRIF